jgi:hypothetical protein
MADDEAVICPLCDLCQLRADEERAMNACTVCAFTLGLVPMAHPRRAPVPCTRCNGMRFTRVIPREHTSVAMRFAPTDPASSAGEMLRSVAAPSVATHEPMVTAKLHSRGRQVAAVDIRTGFGALEMYICRGCGFVEWYCQDPTSIPIGPHYMTEDIDFAGTQPYR